MTGACRVSKILHLHASFLIGQQKGWKEGMRVPRGHTREGARTQYMMFAYNTGYEKGKTLP